MQTTFKLFFSCIFCFALAIVSGCGNNNGGNLDTQVMDSAFAQTRGATGVQWEYKVVMPPTSRDIAERERDFNRLGLEGWELVGSVSSGNYEVCFKRPKR